MDGARWWQAAAAAARGEVGMLGAAWRGGEGEVAGSWGNSARRSRRRGALFSGADVGDEMRAARFARGDRCKEKAAANVNGICMNVRQVCVRVCKGWRVSSWGNARARRRVMRERDM